MPPFVVAQNRILVGPPERETLRICLRDCSADFKISMYKREMEGSPGPHFASQGPSAEDEITRRLEEMSFGPPGRQGFASHRRMLPSGRKSRYTLGRLKKPNFLRKKGAKPKWAVIPNKHTCPFCLIPMESSSELSHHIEKNHKYMYEIPEKTEQIKRWEDYYKGGRRGRTRKARRASRNLRRSSRRE